MRDTVVFEPRSGETWRDPFTMYRLLRDHDPVHHVADDDYWVLTRHRHVFEAVRDTEAYSSAQGLTFTYDERAAAGLDEVSPMVFLDPPDHTAFRRLVASGFTPRRVSDVEPDVRQFVRERLDPIVSAGGGDIVEAVLKPLPSYVVAHYLGVPPADREKFDGWTQGIVAANALGDPLLAAETVGELFTYFTDLIERRRTDPGDDVVSDLVATGDSSGVPPIQILGFAFTMVTGGNDTTTGLLGGALELLDANPAQRDRLAADPTGIPDAIEEFLRLTTPVQGLARTTTRDVEIEGRSIPAGRKVLLAYASANRDDQQFGDDAAECNIERRPKQTVAFGYGAHHCLGAAAARLMGRVALEEILRSCPGFAVDAAAGTFAPGSFVRRYETLPFSVS